MLAPSQPGTGFGRRRGTEHEQGTDRPPRVRPGGRRSAAAQTDRHTMAEHRFVTEVAAAVGPVADPITALVIGSSRQPVRSQCAMSTGMRACSTTCRVTPPSRNSRTRLCV
ncbi:hypothetical protein MRF4_21760 [Methylobacterium radiotolerans]